MHETNSAASGPYPADDATDQKPGGCLGGGGYRPTGGR